MVLALLFPMATTRACGSMPWTFRSKTNPSKRRALSPLMMISRERSFAAADSGAAASQESRRLGLRVTAQTEVGTVCVLPLVSRGRVLGTFGVLKYQDNAFTSDDIEFLTQIANQVAIAVENACAFGEIRELKDKLAQEKLYLENEIRTEMNFAQIVGKSASLRRVLKQVETVAPTDSTVLIYGDTGTGKELIARAIHDLSPRRNKPLVKLTCAAIPTGFVES